MAPKRERSPVALSAKHARILAAMQALSPDRPRPLRYEDIVVKAFEMFPDAFQLRGYPQYPDASDIHKPLYGPLKRLGLVTAANKRFRLTERGLEVARALASSKDLQPKVSATQPRMTRDAEAEIARLLSSNAFALFSRGQQERLLDTDFYGFFRVTVRTPRNDFIGRLSAVEDYIAQACQLGAHRAEQLRELSAHLLDRFAGIVEAKSGRGE